MTTEYSTLGSNTLLLGAPGSGKTHSLRTFVDAGITPFIIMTEPSDVLGDIPPEKCHWKYIAPSNPDWADLLGSATKINSLSFESLSKLEDINKVKYQQYKDLLSALANFTCDRTGRSYGCVDNWNTDRAIVVDSLSGLNIMAMDLVRGSKPTASPGQWGVAMDNLERLVQKLCVNTRCHFVLTGHLEREPDEVTGSVQLMASTLGRKLAPKVPRFFSNVIMCSHGDKGFQWATQAYNVDLKARHLPYSQALPPSFVPLIEGWKKLGGKILPTT